LLQSIAKTVNFIFNIYILAKENFINAWYFRIGEVNKQYDAPHRDRRFPVDRKKNYVRYSNFH
jgi:hypothetical protein